MPSYHVQNFGCRATQADGDAIAESLERRGFADAGITAADVLIVNTCSVTEEAERTARAFLRRVRRGNPQASVIVTGCYAQRAPSELGAIPGVSAVVGNSHKGLVAEIADQAVAARTRVGGGSGQGFVPLAAVADASRYGMSTVLWDDFAHLNLAALPGGGVRRRTRPNLRVQDGCGNRCSFCIIPTTRGPSRSVDLEECLETVRLFAGEPALPERASDAGPAAGLEMVLTGINLGRWGRDLVPVRRFPELVRAILEGTRLPRLRLSSIEPMDWDDSLLELFATYGVDDGASGPRLARHAHLPLQSGSDAILRRMHRRYRPWHYAQRLSRIHARMPDAALGADVMVGFPGETDALFRESYDFIARQPLTYLHLFPFSARPGTPAAELARDEGVSGEAVRERMAALTALAGQKRQRFQDQLRQTTLSAVTLARGAGEEHTAALTDNFVEVDLAEKLPPNRLIRIRIVSMEDLGEAGSGRMRVRAELAR